MKMEQSLLKYQSYFDDQNKSRTCTKYTLYTTKYVFRVLHISQGSGITVFIYILFHKFYQEWEGVTSSAAPVLNMFENVHAGIQYL